MTRVLRLWRRWLRSLPGMARRQAAREPIPSVVVIADRGRLPHVVPYPPDAVYPDAVEEAISR